MSVTEGVLHLKEQHRTTWRCKSERFWFVGLLEEMVELALALVGLHKDSPDRELTQIAAIAMNWLEMRQNRNSSLTPAAPDQATEALLTNASDPTYLVSGNGTVVKSPGG